MVEKRENAISFELQPEHADAIRKLAGGRQVRLAGKVIEGRLSVDFIACNAPFMACNAAFTACNAPFEAKA
jgi:hypothetical protein